MSVDVLPTMALAIAPGGLTTQAQWNNNGTMAGSSGLTLNATHVTALTLANPLSIGQGGTGASTQAQARTNLGLGTLAIQNADNVAITGGRISGMARIATGVGPATGTGALCIYDVTPGNDVVGVYSLISAGGGTNRWNFYASGSAPNYLASTLSIGTFTTYAKIDLGPDETAQKLLIYSNGTNRAGFGAQAFVIRQFHPEWFSYIWGWLQSSDGSTFTEKMRIHTNGYVGIGDTDPQAKLALGNDENGQKLLVYRNGLNRSGLGQLGFHYRIFCPEWINMNFGHLQSGDGSTFTSRMIILPSGAVGINTESPGYTCHINGNGGINGGVWTNTTSRAALKRQIRPLTNALPRVRQLTPRQWEWAEEQPDLEADMPGTQVGFVAEEVAEVEPQWAPPDDHGTLGLAMRGLDAMLVRAVQELDARLQALEGSTP